MTSECINWSRFVDGFFHDPEGGLSLDVSRMNFDDHLFEGMAPQIRAALDEMGQLERGSLANPDEERMVGHYWLRAPEFAPSEELTALIQRTVERIISFSKEIHQGTLTGSTGERFSKLLLIGIGGSALGPQFVTRALGGPADRLRCFFFDNTDPEGMRVVLEQIGSLTNTLVLVISKSGSTKETRNGQMIVREAFRSAGLDPSKHMVAVTGEGSELDRTAEREGWVSRFPMWDWVGGRTSELSAVGLLPAALQGYEIRQMLAGARHMDRLTRATAPRRNPAMLLALMWWHAGQGKGTKDMVLLPYNDRLELASRYLQQLIMESLGKELDRNGEIVHQGIAVYGNKGSTDQHAYVQQLREGIPNFFVTFIEVLRNDPLPGKSTQGAFQPSSVEVEPGVTAGDYLAGFLQGTRKALFEKGRESITLTIPLVDEFQIGQIIALFERAVGYYATLINVNAYHQPGVEAGKKAAAEVLVLQKQVLTHLRERQAKLNARELAIQLRRDEDAEDVFRILRHLYANGRVRCEERVPLVDSLYFVSQ